MMIKTKDLAIIGGVVAIVTGAAYAVAKPEKREALKDLFKKNKEEVVEISAEDLFSRTEEAIELGGEVEDIENEDNE